MTTDKLLLVPKLTSYHHFSITLANVMETKIINSHPHHQIVNRIILNV